MRPTLSRPRRLGQAAAVLAVASFFPARAHATSYYFVGGGTHDPLGWSDSGNWGLSPAGPGGAGLPASGDDAFLTTAASNPVSYDTSLFSLPNPNLDSIHIDYATGAFMDDFGGTLTISNSSANGGLLIAESARGSIELGSGGAISDNGNEEIGLGGSGLIFQVGGVHTVDAAHTVFLAKDAASSGAYTITSGTLADSGSFVVGYGGSGTLSQAGGSVTIGSELSFADLSTSQGTGTLSGGSLSAATIAIGNSSGAIGQVSISSSAADSTTDTLIAAGSTLSLSGGTLKTQTISSAGAISVTGGRLSLTGNLSLGTGSITSLSIGGGTVDLGSAGLIINYGAGPSPISSLSTAAKNAADPDAGGIPQWDKPGLTSNLAQADYSNNQATGVGVIDNQDYVSADGQTWKGSSFVGVTVTTDNVALARYTYYGDTNLDGVVDGTDVTNIQLGMAGGTQGDNWFYGDFNYSGTVDGTDVTLLILGFDAQGAEPLVDPITAPQADWLLSEAQGLTPAEIQRFESLVQAPEPTTLAFAAAATSLLLRRHRR